MLKKLFYLFFIFVFSLYGSNKIITVAQGAKPKSLDFQRYNEFTTLGITEHIYNTLLTLDENGLPKGELAKEFQYLSDTEILLTIRENVKFHNGETLTVDDVIFSINRMLQNPSGKVLLNELKEVKKISSNQVILVLKEPSTSFLGKLTLPGAAILNKKYVESGKDIGFSPMGTGPYKFSKWKDSDTLCLESFKEYFKGSPKNDGLNFKIITDNNSRVMALESGDVDIIYAVSPIDFSLIESNPNLKLITKKTVTTDYLGINVSKKYLNNPELRKAIRLAIDRKGILTAIFLNKGSIATSPISPNIFASYQNASDIQNVKKAKEIIKKFNVPLHFKLWTSDNNIRVQIAQIIQSNLKDVGINIDIEIVEWGTFLKKTSQGEHDLFLSTWILGVSDIDTIVSKLFLSSSIGSEGNRSFYSNKILDEKIKKARTIKDLTERKKAYEEIQTILYNENPIIPLIYRIDGIGVNKRIKSFIYNKASMRNIYEQMEIIE